MARGYARRRYAFHALRGAGAMLVASVRRRASLDANRTPETKRQAALRHLLQQPLHRAARACSHHRQWHLHVVVVEHLEAVVAFVAEVVERAHQCRNLVAVRAFARKYAEMPCRLAAT